MSGVRVYTAQRGVEAIQGQSGLALMPCVRFVVERRAGVELRTWEHVRVCLTADDARAEAASLHLPCNHTRIRPFVLR